MKFLVFAAVTACYTAPPQAPIDASIPRTPHESTGDSPPRDGAYQARIDRAELARLLEAPSPRPRVYNFWATWCGPCVAEMPTLDAFAGAHPQIDVWFVNTDHPKVASAKVDRFIIEHGLDDRLHLRPASAESDLTAAIVDFPQVLPVTVIVAPTGQRGRTIIGAVDANSLDEALEGLGKPLP